jgi:hypothetical protein
MIPIRIQQFPAFAQQVTQRSRVLALPLERQPKFHLCYFSCQSYFKYLYCALHSLKTVGTGLRYRVIVFSDTDMPLSEAQIAALHELMPDLSVVPWPKSMGWGATQIGWIWKAYALALEGAAEGDIIARIDSDVFFFNDRIFRAVERSDADLVGDGHYVRLEFCQGGCYFFKAHAVRRILEMLEREPLEEIVKEIDPVVEDVAATHFTRRLGMKVWMTWFMMFPDELRNAGGLTRWARWKFSCAHFVMKNKSAMLAAYDKDVLGGEVPAHYLETLDIP